MIRAHWPNIARKKVSRFLKQLEAEHGTIPRLEKLRLCYQKYDLSTSFLYSVANDHDGRAIQPSSRTLSLLGYEVLVRDVETGEEEVLKLIGYQCEGPITSPHFFNESRTTRKDQFTGKE